MVNDATIGDIFYTTRKIEGVTQVELAKRLGVVQSTISKVEKNIFDDVPFNLISNFCEIFNVPIISFQKCELRLKKNQFKSLFPDYFLDPEGVSVRFIINVISFIPPINGNVSLNKKIGIWSEFRCIENLFFSGAYLDVYRKYFTRDILQIALEKTEGFEKDKEFIHRYLNQGSTNLNAVSAQSA